MLNITTEVLKLMAGRRVTGDRPRGRIRGRIENEKQEL